MVMDVYNRIGVPAKCGSRYFDKTTPIFGFPQRLSFREFFLIEIHLDWIIIRNPMEHLKSALQTEIMNCFNDVNGIREILESFLNLYDGGTHFYPQFCQKIYEVWYKTGFKLKVVDLSNLSDFLNNEFGIDIPYHPEEFSFVYEDNYVPKDIVWDKCISGFPELMNKLIDYAKNDLQYYQALLNGDRKLVKIL